ncbi:Hsp20/alpha crystallin family protein [Thomasclavelia sp.]|uniref:Hsp20/alpha crystallin family protein n=1 Tax=Thomasclavelia sp. TaxID=3025757 RepID=UPI0025D77C01|nr:Hsp20/alpha crystallin family protein [Thomasclavelia sp.]
MKLLPGFTTFDDVFDNMFNDPFFKGSTSHMRTDVKEVGDNYQLAMEVPGFSKDDISIELRDGYLNISANKSTNNDEKDTDGNIIRRERYSGSCSRSFYVGEDVKQEDIKASYNNGELIITLPKVAPKQVETNSRYIPID